MRNQSAYAVKVHNYLKGWYELHIFDTRKDAEKYKKSLEAVVNSEVEDMYVPYSELAIAYEDELSWNDEVFKQRVSKGYWITKNTNGRVHQELCDLRIVNNDNPVEIPA